MSSDSPRWRGYQLFDDVRKEVEETLRRFFAPYAEGGGPGAKPTWSPRVDVLDSESAYTIIADLPGVDPASLEVILNQGTLTLRGERVPDTIDPTSRYRQHERPEGAFERQITLPAAVDVDSITARSRWGVVTITIRKQPGATPRRISVAPEEG